jgi:hypothetical protein
MTITDDYKHDKEYFNAYFPDHQYNNDNCQECKYELKLHGFHKWLKVDYPVECKCGGLIHTNTEYEGDDGYEFAHTRNVCDKCFEDEIKV